MNDQNWPKLCMTPINSVANTSPPKPIYTATFETCQSKLEGGKGRVYIHGVDLAYFLGLNWNSKSYRLAWRSQFPKGEIQQIWHDEMNFIFV